MAIVYLLCGKVGCGKSTYANWLRTEKNAVVLSSDDLMMCLFDSCIGPDKHQEYLSRCKKFLYIQAEDFVKMGFDVALDFGFWQKSERTEVAKMFAEKGIETKLAFINTDYDTITNNLNKRNTLVENGETRAYHIDDEKRQRFDAMFQAPSENEEHMEIIQSDYKKN